MENEITERFQVTPCGDFNCQSFPLVEGNVYLITEEEMAKLRLHELKWSTEEYEADEPVYEEYEETYVETEPDLEKPITETRETVVQGEDGETTTETYEVIVGYEEREVEKTRTATRQIGTNVVTKTRPILIPNDPTEENLETERTELRSERAKAFKAFDIYKTNVQYGIVSETEEAHARIVMWYDACLDLEAEAIRNMPKEIARFAAKA